MKVSLNIKKIFSKFKIALNDNIVLSTLIIGVSLICAFSVLGLSLQRSFFVRTLTVKGFSEKVVKADFAIWNIEILKVGSDLVRAQKLLDKDLKIIREFLSSYGFKEEEIDNSSISVRDKFAGYDYMQLKEANSVKERRNERYVIKSGIVVKSNKVDLVEKVYRETGKLVRSGVTLSDSYSSPAYLFKGFKDIKNEMLQDATKNALITAKQFAKDAGDSIKSIKTANQGVFSISPQNASTSWENELNHIMKEIRVVTTITYILK